MSRKLGVTKKKEAAAKVAKAVKSETVAHTRVPGRAYEMSDPTAKLITQIGGGFFNEPRYYDKSRSAAAFYGELCSTGAISSVYVDKMGLSEQAQLVIETAHHVAQSDHPEDLLVIAAWARDAEKGLKLRYTPQIMLCIAAANERTKQFVPFYGQKIIRRADEIRHVFAAYRHLFCRQENGLYAGAIPRCLRKALSLALASQKLYGLLKYDSKDRPTYGDILLALRGRENKAFLEKQLDRKLTNWPLSAEVYDYFVNGKIGKNAPAMLKARERFFAIKSIDELPEGLLSEAGLTWENIISHLGSTKATWELVIPQMGEMALMRNLRNFEDAGISPEAWDLVHEQCDGVTTKQLPFRFFSAETATKSSEAHSVAGKMLDAACQNLPPLDGVTAVFVDNSGSTTGCRVGGKSDRTVADAGNVLAAVLCKKVGRKCKVGVFGDSLIWVPLAETDSCMNMKHKIDLCANRDERSKHNALAISKQWRSGPGCGGATETGLWCGIHDLTERKVHVDRIIIISDMCCYTQGDAYNCGRNMNDYFGSGGESATIQYMIDTYRRRVNADAWVHTIDLQGYGEPQVKPGAKRVQMLSGWSEQVFSIIYAAEGQTQQAAVAEEVPTIELLRQRYQIQQQ